MIGIQEARSFSSGTFRSDDYFRIVPPLDDRAVGDLELWLSCSLPWGTFKGQPFFLLEHHFSIAHVADRWFAVAIRSPCVKLDVIIAHGVVVWGDSKKQIAEAVLMWKFISAYCHARPSPHHPVVLLIDANTKLGSVRSTAIGERAPDHENEAGEALHQIMLDFDLAAPSTFHEYHRGQDYTWTGGPGFTTRIDFVIVPRSWLPGTVFSKVLTDVDLLASVLDHFCTAAGICFLESPQTTTP